MRRFRYALAVAVLIIATDQLTKYLVVNFIHPLDSIEIFPFLHLVNVKNKGAAFGLFGNIGSGFFIAVSVIAIIFVLWLLIRGKEDHLSLSLILGGAIGNLIDRVSHGYVMDFIDFSVGTFHWPAFNVADSALTIGIVVILLSPLLKKMHFSADSSKR